MTAAGPATAAIAVYRLQIFCPHSALPVDLNTCIHTDSVALSVVQRGPLQFDDLHYKRRKYGSWGAYGECIV